MNKLNLIGKRYGKLTVISEDGRSNIGGCMWLCKCDCGNTKRTAGINLQSGNTNSCGCLQRERCKEALTKHGRSKRCTEYYSWVNMKTRCYNQKCADYKDYGGRGITVCDRWLNSFENFLADMGEKPKGCSIDRIITNGNYEPGNCRWSTDLVQSRNKRTNRWIEFNGLKMILQDWADYFGVNQGNLSQSIKARGIEGVYNFYLTKHGSLPYNRR